MLKLLLPIFICSLTSTSSSFAHSKLETSFREPAGFYRLISYNKIPHNSGGLGMLSLNLAKDGTFARQVGTRDCLAATCPPSKKINATGRFSLKSENSKNSIHFFDQSGAFLDSWNYVFFGTQLRLWLETPGSSGLTAVSTGGVKDLEQNTPEMLLEEIDNGRTVTIEVGQSLAVQLPVDGGRWETIGAMDSLTSSSMTMTSGFESPVPQGMIRTIFTAAHHSIGEHPLRMRYLNQSGVPSRSFNATIKVIAGALSSNVSCPPKGCVWLGLENQFTSHNIEIDQPIVVTLTSSQLYSAECTYSYSDQFDLSVSAWLGEQPVNDVTSRRFIWAAKAFKPGSHYISCITPLWGTVGFHLNISDNQ